MAQRIDPRWLQIASLLGLLVYGIEVLDFDVAWSRVAALLASCLVAEALWAIWAIWTVWAGWRRGGRGGGTARGFDPRSPAISALSLALLLRTEDPRLAVLAGGLAIASKALLRWRGKHVFNPTCFALVALLALDASIWVSPGQWGDAAHLGFALVCSGLAVLRRSRRGDITLAFLAAYAGGLFARALWLGDPLAIPLHSLRSGALLLFAFFMISDPRTVPDTRPGRVLFAVAVAALALWLQFALYWNSALLWALALCAPLTPVLDALLPGERFTWRRARGGATRARPQSSLRKPRPVAAAATRGRSSGSSTSCFG